MRKRSRDIPSVPTAGLADAESEESAMTEEIVKKFTQTRGKETEEETARLDCAPQDTEEEIPTPGTPKIPACMKKRAKK